MTPFDAMTPGQLAALDLQRGADGLRIVWTPDANIHHMTLGRHLGPETRVLPAMIYDAPDGTVTVQGFADVDRAATGLAATLRGLGYGAGDQVGLHTGQHPDTAVAHMAIAKLEAVAVTLSQLYGPDTLNRRALRAAEERDGGES